MTEVPVYDVRILRDAAGTNPGGTRYLYATITSNEDRRLGQEALQRTSHEAIQSKTGAPNLHPHELTSGKVILEAALIERDFVKV